MNEDLKGYAVFIGKGPGPRADQRVYVLVPPHEGYQYVTVSAARVADRDECLIFGAEGPDGNIVSYFELSGSRYETLDHAEVLRAAGYVVDTDFTAAMRAAADAGRALQERAQALRETSAQVVAFVGRMVAECAVRGGES